MTFSTVYRIAIFLSVTLFSCGFKCFVPTLSRQQARHNPPTILLLAKQQEDKEDSGKQGYQFGDITRGFIKKATSSINEVTGKDAYTFGDLSRFADAKAKERINSITGQDEYKLGDLSRWADSEVKTKIANYTGKEDYVVGDVSKEIIRRVSMGEYATEDVVLLCKALLTFGVGLSPVARILPAKLLLEMMQFGLAEEVGGRLMGAVSKTLDERFKETITGDPNYKLGDKTKEAVSNLMAMASEKDSATKRGASGNEMDSALIAELEDWDRRLGISGNEKGTGGTTK